MSVNDSLTNLDGDQAHLRSGHAWLLAVLVVSATLMGCASESRVGTDNELGTPENTGAMKQPEPNVVHRDGFFVMGTVARRAPGTERHETFASIWNDFEAHRASINQHSVDSKYYGVSFAAGSDGSFDYLAGMAVKPVKEIPEGLEVRAVPAATYAVFTCAVQSIGQTYQYIFSEWRAESGYETDDAKAAFEEYPPATDTNAPVLLHIPIRESHAK